MLVLYHFPHAEVSMFATSFLPYKGHIELKPSTTQTYLFVPNLFLFFVLSVLNNKDLINKNNSSCQCREFHLPSKVLTNIQVGEVRSSRQPIASVPSLATYTMRIVVNSHLFLMFHIETALVDNSMQMMAIQYSSRQ